MNYTHHRDYKICEHCGSTLDHGERCDCQDTKCEICGDTLKLVDLPTIKQCAQSATSRIKQTI